MSKYDIQYFGFAGMFISIMAAFVIILFAIWGAFSVFAVKIVATVFIVSSLTAFIGNMFFDE